VLVLCLLFLSLFAVLIGTNKPAASFRWQRVVRESSARFGLLAQEHDRQPTTVVVMPMCIEAATVF